jgi:hypothetical protein
MIEWRPVPSNDLYEASDTGVIRRDGRLLKPRTNRTGYLCVGVWRDGKRSTRQVHALVAEAFYGIRPPGLQVGHANGFKRDNRACNLRYITPKQNIAESIRDGTHPRGEWHWCAKMTDAQVLEARRIHRPRTRATGIRALAHRYGVSNTTMEYALNGKSWAHLPSIAELAAHDDSDTGGSHDT